VTKKLDDYDPFPKTGRVKQYEPFIRNYVGEFCKNYPGAIFEHVLIDAVRIAHECEARFRPELGYDFSTPLRKWLMRLQRIYVEERSQVRIGDTGDPPEEFEEIPEPIVYRGGNGTRVTIDRQWMIGRKRHRIVFGMQLRSADESDAREAIDRLSATVSKYLNGQPLPEIKADIIRGIGTEADIRFYKGREPPNFHKFSSTVLPGHMFVAFDERVGREKENDDGALFLRDVLGGANPQGFRHSDPEVDKLQRAITDELPLLSPKERQVLAWKLDKNASTLSQFAAEIGISKGYASKLHDRVVQRLTDRMKKT
jgi:hypothetical protein